MVKRIKPRAPLTRRDDHSLPLEGTAEDLTNLEATEQRTEGDAKGRFDRRGARSKYNPELFPRTTRFLVARGATQDEVADCLGISKRTLQYWLNEYPELSEAFQAGRDVFLPKVERALAERALGFWIQWEEWEDGAIRQKRKYYPPDVTAQIFFLKNTDPTHWRDVHKLEHTGNVFSTSAALAGELQKRLEAMAEQGMIDVTPRRQLTPPDHADG